MINQVSIIDAKGPRFFTHADFPLSVGTSPSADIYISSKSSISTAAILIIIVNRAYIEANKKNVSIRVNDEIISGQKQLQHDDILEIEDSTFHCEHIGDTLSISIYDDQAHLASNEEEAIEHGQVIEPIEVPQAKKPERSGKVLSRMLSIFSLLLFGGIALALAYIFTAKSLLIEIEPAADRIELSGDILPIKIRGRYLVQPGVYALEASKTGYYPLEQKIRVSKHQSQTVTYTLQKKPGYLHVTSTAKSDVLIVIDDKEIGLTPIENFELGAGTYSLEASANRYQPYSTQVVIEGKEKHQQLEIDLIQDWAKVSIESTPTGADVWIDGEKLGVTPYITDLQTGEYHLELLHTDYIPYEKDFVVVANEDLTLPIAELYSSPSHLLVTSTPAKAIVSIAGENKGVTPVTLRLNPNTEHTITLSKPGFKPSQQNVTLKVGEQQNLSTKLEAILGTLILNVEPEDSEVFINGKFVGNGSLKLSLPSTSQRVEIRKSGFEVYEKMISPSSIEPKVMNVHLKRITNASKVVQTNTIRTSQGQELRLIYGGRFSMGSSRREQGRRSNETLHFVELQKPFYISATEVSNTQFAEFMAEHSSGEFKGYDLSSPNLPVSNIGWNDAARFCNWLSEKEGLDKVYREQNGIMVAVDPIPPGYRLPTESEWEWVARVQTNDAILKYSWGNDFPPTEVAGNFADQSATGILDEVITDYHDGFVVTAPVGSFRENRFGIFNLGGNVAEWCHDYYSVYPSLSDEVFIDPVGPSNGSKHIIRGASWMKGDLSTTRLSYREAGSRKRIDVGFRIAKYID